MICFILAYFRLFFNTGLLRILEIYITADCLAPFLFFLIQPVKDGELAHIPPVDLPGYPVRYLPDYQKHKCDHKQENHQNRQEYHDIPHGLAPAFRLVDQWIEIEKQEYKREQ